MATYGSPLYGAGVILNRIAPELKTAQAAAVRQTGLKVSVLDTQINRWEEWTGTPLFPGDIVDINDKAYSVDQAYRGYRLGMGMCILTGGKIIRVRVGNGTFSDRNIYYQEITDPTTLSQWTSWTLLYSGTHYAVAVVPATSTTYHVYSAKSDGIYKNNVKKQSITGVIEINPLQGQVDAMFVTRVLKDSIDDRRVLDHYYSSDIESVAFADDRLNYRWFRSEISALLLSDGRVARAQVAGFYINPRSTNLAESLTISFAASYSNIEPITPPYIVRGFAGQAGSNAITNPFLTKMSDGFYYLFYSESRYDYDKTVAINSTSTVFWQRSVDLINWSEPVAVGFTNMNPTGIAIVESGGYAYLANNGSVFRRPLSTTTYDITNYVSRVELEIPKDNEPGGSTIMVANPAGVHDALLNLTDCETKIEVGLRCADGVYRYSEFGRWWINKVNRQIDKETNRLQLSVYDLWKRLDNPLRDNYNNIGCLNWLDWATSRRNELFNYSMKGGTYKATSDGTSKYVAVTNPTSKNFFLFTGWKGHNGEVEFRFRNSPLSTRKIGVIYRYIDDNNYYWAYSNGATIYLIRVRGGTSTTLATDSTNISGWFKLKVIFRWGIHRVYLNGTLQFTHNETLPGGKPGYVGVRGTGSGHKFDQFKFTDWQPNITSNSLITTLLAMGDFHSPSVAGGEAPQLAVVWGPQTDLNTPAKAITSLCNELKLNLAWRGGRIEVGQFKEKTIVGTFEDEILSASRTEEIGRRINLASVDGRDDSWIEIDGPDTRFRGRQIVGYFDVPELKTDDEVRLRASEEIRKGVIGSAYEAELPLQFDLWKMDGITMVDNSGTSKDLRVEGMMIEVQQDQSPRQLMKLELSPLT